MAQSYAGRLELTWTNKALALLAADDGNYQWVPTSDYRVAEVRLLHDAGTVGDVRAKRDRARDNLLIQGDALNALTSLIELPEFAREYVGEVKLAYLDPPFNTQKSFLHYDDALEHSVWLTMLRDRLQQVKRLLASDGSVWLHLDDDEVHRARCVLDEVFGLNCYVGTIVWQKADSPRMDAKQFSSSHDYLLVYSRNPNWIPNQAPLAAADDDDDEADSEDAPGYPYADPDGRRFKSSPLRKWGKNSRRQDRPTLWYAITGPDGGAYWPVKPDKTEGRWRWKKAKVETDSDRLHWIDKGSGFQPYVKTYEDEEAKPRPYETWWPNEQVGHNREAKAHIKQLFGRNEAFETPKPERLIERVLTIGSNPGDVVLDCFGGSGTTAAVAQKMGRRWLLIERERSALHDVALPRLRRVVDGLDPGGITQRVGWRGGGGFRILEVSPSMFAEDHGTVVLADWATNGQLSEATAAQLGFDFETEPPFVGRKGRKRLAVVDGMVTADVVHLLTDALAADERLTVCGMAFDPDARQILREKAPGSTLRKIPSSILDEYVQRRMEQAAFGVDMPIVSGK